MPNKIERRFFGAEVRVGATDGQGDEMVLTGYAAKFNTQSEDLGGFRETIMPGTFARALREKADVKALMNHDPSLVLGRTTNGTLEMSEDAVGLKFRVVLPNTTAARDAYALVKRGDISGCSFAFKPVSEDWEDVRDGNGDLYANRKLMDVDLIDVSPVVTYPAYSDTEVNARFTQDALVEVRGALKKLEEKRGSEAQAPKPGDLNWLLSPDVSEDWWNAFSDAYSDLVKKGGRGYAVKEALGLAVAQANAKVQPDTETDPVVNGQKKADVSGVPHDLVDTDGDDDADQWERHIRRGEFRYTEGSYEDLASDINWALTQKYGYNYWLCETFPDKIIVQNSADGCFYQVGYTQDDDCVMFTGDLVKVEQQFVMTERMKQVGEARVYKSKADVPDYVPDEKKGQWKDVWNSSYKSAKKENMSDDDAEKKAFAEANGVAGPKSNRDGVSDPNSPDYDPDDPEYDPDWEENSKKAKLDETNRAADKTKKVGGKSLTSDNFAFVGDATDPSTWKLPIHDKAHAQNALARFNQTKGIPADKKDGVYKKIVAAAKKFGIEVSEKDSIRCGYEHSVTLTILNELGKPTEEQLKSQLAARLKVIEIELD